MCNSSVMPIVTLAAVGAAAYFTGGASLSAEGAAGGTVADAAMAGGAAADVAASTGGSAAIAGAGLNANEAALASFGEAGTAYTIPSVAAGAGTTAQALSGLSMGGTLVNVIGSVQKANLVSAMGKYNAWRR